MWNIRTREEIENSIRAAALAATLIGERDRGGDYLDGYLSALRIVATGLGVEFEPEPELVIVRSVTALPKPRNGR
jgi:hypothetical protein